MTSTSAGRNGDGRGLMGRVAGAVTGRVVDAVDPDIVLAHVDVDALVERIDIDAALARVDIQGLLDRVDLSALMERVDLDAAMARVDVDALVARVEVNDVLARVDPNLLLARVDPQVLLDRVDVDALIARVDPQAVVDRVDVDALLARVDPQAIVDRIDMDALVARVDVGAIVQRSGIPDVVADSTRSMAASMIDLGRRQLVGLDVILERLVFRMLRRGIDQLIRGPAALTGGGSSRRTETVSGNYAGAFTRAASGAIDIGVVIGLYTLGAAGLDVLGRVLFGLELGRGGPWGVVALALWAFVYVFIGLLITGRTIGKAVTGLRVIRADGTTPRGRVVFVRTLALPLSLVLFGVGLLLVPVRRDHRALHDLVAGTAVVYDWGDRSAEMPGPLADFLNRVGYADGPGTGDHPRAQPSA
jgi:uncharacterized RDD family membrane protein YckC